MAMISDFSKAPEEILVDLINHDNGTSLTVESIEFEPPTAVSGARNTSIVIRGALGAAFIGEVTLSYNRISLPNVVGGGETTFLLSPAESALQDIFNRFNARYGVNITEEDVVGQGVPLQAGTYTFTLQAAPDSLVFNGQVALTLQRMMEMFVALPNPFVGSLSLTAGSESVTPTDKLMALINAEVGPAQNAFNPGNVTFGVPAVVSGAGYNTQVQVTAVPDQGFSGVVSIYYQRIDLAAATAGVGLVSEDPFTDQQLISGFNAEKSSFLKLTDLSAVVIPAMDTGVVTAVPVAALVNSLAWMGTGSIDVVIGIPAQAGALNTMMNVTYPSYFGAWDVAAHDVFVPPTFPAPVNTVAPAVSGVASVGETLICTAGSWSGSGNTYNYQWKADGVNIAAAIVNNYVVLAGDAGKSITCLVTATNSGGTASQLSNATVIALPAPVADTAPVVSGATAIGSVLSTTDGTWTGSALSYSYQWKADGVNIGGATGNTYQTVVGDAGKTITCVVTASNTGGAASQASNGIVVAAAAGDVAMVAVQDDTVNTGAIRSTDGGVTWANQGLTDTSRWAAIGYGAGQFVALAYAVEDASVNYVTTSPTGLVWTGHPGVAGAWKDVAYSASLGWCAVGDDGRIATSADGVNWTQQFLDANIYFFGVAWSGANFVAMGYTHGFAAACYTSPDGVTWTSRASVNGAAWNAVRSDGAGTCVAVANGGVIASSLNHGVNWTNRVSNCSSPLGAVVWTGTTFVVGGQYEIATSPDAITWTNRASGDPIAVPADCLGWSGTQVVALSHNSVYTSADQGATWTERALAPNLYWRKVAAAL